MAKFQVGAIHACLTTDGQMHTIGKALRPLFADLVTYILLIYNTSNTKTLTCLFGNLQIRSETKY